MFEIAIFAGEINPYTALHNINYIFSGIESDAGMCGWIRACTNGQSIEAFWNCSENAQIE